jgi:ABC-type Na+ transport system ATPase subunit NatA
MTARIRPVLALERLTFLEPEGKVGYRWGRDGAGQETMDYLEFIARVTSHIPDKGQVMVRYYGLYANAHRGKAKKASLSPSNMLFGLDFRIFRCN